MATNTKIAIIHATEPSSTGTQDYTSAGFGTPVACMVIGTTNTSTDSVQGNLNGTIGFTDGSNERSVTCTYVDNVSTSRSRRFTVDTVYARNDVDYSNNLSKTASFDSWITDGVRLNWTLTDDEEFNIIVILIGGDDVTAECGDLTPNGSVDGTTQVSGLSNEPQVIFFIGNGRAFDDGSSNDVVGWCGFGIGINNDGSFKNVSHSISTDHHQANANVGSIICNNRCFSNVNARDEELEFALELTAATSSSFTVTTRDNNQNMGEVGYLSLNLNGDSFDLVSQALATGTGTQDWPSSGSLDFAPEIAFLGASINTSVNTYQTADSANSLGVDATDETVGCHGTWAESGLATTNAEDVVSNTKILWVDDGTNTSEKQASISSWGTDKITLNYSTCDSNTAYGFALLIGSPAAAIARNQAIWIPAL